MRAPCRENDENFEIPTSLGFRGDLAMIAFWVETKEAAVRYMYFRPWDSAWKIGGKMGGF